MRSVPKVHAKVAREAAKDHTRALSADERTALLAYVDSQAARAIQHPGPRAKAEAVALLTAFMMGTGVRISEARALRWDDVDLDAATCTSEGRSPRPQTGRSVFRRGCASGWQTVPTHVARRATSSLRRVVPIPRRHGTSPTRLAPCARRWTVRGSTGPCRTRCAALPPADCTRRISRSEDRRPTRPHRRVYDSPCLPRSRCPRGQVRPSGGPLGRMRASRSRSPTRRNRPRGAGVPGRPKGPGGGGGVWRRPLPCPDRGRDAARLASRPRLVLGRCQGVSGHVLPVGAPQDEGHGVG